MKSLFLSLTTVVILSLTACDDNADFTPAPVAGVSRLQFDIINDQDEPSATTATISIHVYKQSLIDEKQTIVLDSTFTLDLLTAPEKISVVRSIDIIDVNKEVVVSCGSVRHSNGHGVTRCSYADQQGALTYTELSTKF